METVRVFPQELPLRLLQFELSVKALVVLGFFFYQLPCFGEVVNPEVTHLINEFILGLICNSIASLREGVPPERNTPWDTCPWS